MSVQFPDISSYQSGISLAGLPAVIVKATEGGDTAADRYVNPDYHRAIAEAQTRSVVACAYHFLLPGNVDAEAAYCFGVVGSEVVLMVDAEKGSLTVGEIVEFAAAYRRLNGKIRLVYLPEWYWASIGRPDLSPLRSAGLSIVSSNYPAGGYTINGPGWAGYGGIVPAIWQFTDNATVNGVHPVDMNAYAGTVEELYAELYGTAMAFGAPSYPGRMFQLKNPQMSGGDVRIWQQRIRDRGWTIGVDGQYGPQSEQVCREFQQDSTNHNWPLTVDGVVGPATWMASWERPISA